MLGNYGSRTQGTLLGDYQWIPDQSHVPHQDGRSKPVSSSTEVTEGVEPQTLEEKFLEEHVDPDYGLLDKLVGSGVLSSDESAAIRAKESMLKRNEELMKIMKKKNEYSRLLETLSSTDQSHLINYILSLNNGLRSDHHFNDDLPLTYKEKMTLDLNRDILVDSLTGTSELAKTLYLESIINKRQRDHVCSFFDTKANEILIDILRRRSIINYKGTVECLRRMNQKIVADILEGKVIGRLWCHIDGETDFKKREFLLTELSHNLSCKSYFGSFSEFLRMKPEHIEHEPGFLSIFLHFPSILDAFQMQKKLSKLDTKNLVEKEFCNLLSEPDETISIKVEWRSYDYDRCVQCFNHILHQQVDCLPLELLDVVISKAALLQMYSSEASCPDEKSIFIGLASVDKLWSSRTKQRNVKNTIKSLCAVRYQRVKKREKIIKHNLEYLKEVMDPNGVIHQLQTNGCLSEGQAISLGRLGNARDKIDQLLNLVQYFSWQNYSKFLECLYRTYQPTAATILEVGGETIKAQVTNKWSRQKEDNEVSLVNTIQKIQAKNAETLKSIGIPVKHGFDDAFIFHARQNKGIEVWFWCRTETALKKLKSTSERVLLEIVHELYSQLMPNLEVPLEPQSVSIDWNEYTFTADNEFATRHLLVQPVGSCAVGGLASSVAVLMDRIYVVKERTVVVYQNKTPYEKLEEIELIQSRLFTTPCTIKACKINNCLYVGDPDTDYIYRIEPVSSRTVAWLNLTNAFIFTVSSDGNVLVFDTSSQVPGIRVFSPSAESIRSVPVKLGLYLTYHNSSIAEIMPDIVAFTCKGVNERPISGADKFIHCVLIMRLDAHGTVLHRIDWKSEIKCILPFFSSGILITELRSKRMILFDYRQSSVRTPEFLSTDGALIDLCFAADQRLLFALNADEEWKVDIVRVQYEDEQSDL